MSDTQTVTGDVPVEYEAQEATDNAMRGPALVLWYSVATAVSMVALSIGGGLAFLIVRGLARLVGVEL